MSSSVNSSILYKKSMTAVIITLLLISSTVTLTPSLFQKASAQLKSEPNPRLPGQEQQQTGTGIYNHKNRRNQNLADYQLSLIKNNNKQALEFCNRNNRKEKRKKINKIRVRVRIKLRLSITMYEFLFQ